MMGKFKVMEREDIVRREKNNNESLKKRFVGSRNDGNF